MNKLQRTLTKALTEQYPTHQLGSKRKYNNVSVLVDNHIFDSKAEAKRYKQLKMLQDVHEISGLELQPKFLLQQSFIHENKIEREISYIADFKYYDVRKKKWIVEDVKGMRTEVYKIKRKMFLFRYPLLTFFES